MKQLNLFLFLFLIAFTANAQEQLDIDGAIKISDSTNPTPQDGTIRYNGTDFFGRKSGTWESLTGAGSNIWLQATDDVYYPRINGQVGIGLTDPNGRLHLKHSSTSTPQLRLEETTDDLFGKMYMVNSNNPSVRWAMSYNTGTTADHEIGWYYNGSPKLVYDQTLGGLGINNKNPKGTVHIFDNTRDTLTLLMTPHTAGEKSSKIIMAEDFAADHHMAWMYNGNGNRMELYGHDDGIDYGPHFQVRRNSGDIAMGDTFASGYKLSVDGKIICEELQVELKGDWPDYVFTDDYNLTPLSEVERFIQQNRHLPGVPSASVIEEEGIAVGEMQKVMMEKIEELTLHIIALEKEIKDLKESK